MATFKLKNATDFYMSGANPADGQVMQYSVAAGNVWTPTNPSAASGLTPTAKTANYTAASGDHVLANATSAAITITLPAATAGATVRVTKTDASSNGVIVRPASGVLNNAGLSGSLTNTAKTANYTAVSLDHVQANATSGRLTVTLPAPANGAWVRVTKTDSTVNGVLVVPPSGTVDGDASAAVNSQFYGQNFVGDGSAWHYAPDHYAFLYTRLLTQDFVCDGTTWWAL